MNHPVYKSKLKKFTTPAFNFDEVVKLPDNSVHLAFNKTNKIQGLAFKSGNCDIWGLQYHPEIHYDYMIRLINDRRKKLIKKKCFKNDEEIDHHINSETVPQRQRAKGRCNYTQAWAWQHSAHVRGIMHSEHMGPHMPYHGWSCMRRG